MRTKSTALYFKEISRFPMLNAEEELMLVARWRENGDRDATHQLVTSHLRLVPKIARNYRGYGLPNCELISEGNLGLFQALKGFDPDKGVRFSSYAGWWIKAAMQAYILRSWSLVKIGTTANQKRLFFGLSRAKRRLLSGREGNLRPEETALIANWLGVNELDVVEMDQRLGGDVSLNVPVMDDGNSIERQDLLVADIPDQELRIAERDELQIRMRALDLALADLDDRERHIFEARRLIHPPRSCESIGGELRISGERVRQIEAQAFNKVRSAMHRTTARLCAVPNGPQRDEGAGKCRSI
ncbi:RNA polymerase factor sigma-32 [Bradyrhizobium niftali]|uniref:RNA polymerase factor sigma-32 n=1 Tax=Bradyrhizobium niftali TaxID=2560055 RepID=UPI00384F4FD3